MLVRSASHAAYAYEARPSIATEAAKAAQTSKAAQSTTSALPGVGGSLFSNGQFTGSAQLTSPETLAALFQLNADGTVAHGDAGGAINKKGVFNETAQGRMAQALAMGPRETWSAADVAAANEAAKITDDDKAMFRQVTGYNLFVSGPITLIVDDQGNSPSAQDAAPAKELLNRLQYARTTGQTVDADWFNGVSKDIADWGGPKFPADWDKRAEDWFDDVMTARREAKTAASDNGDGQAMASKSVERSQMTAATQAYNEAAKLAGPSSPAAAAGG